MSGESDGWGRPWRLGKASIPNGLPDPLLSLHSDIERQLSSFFVPPDTAPVPSSHDKLTLARCPVRVQGEKRELFKEDINGAIFRRYTILLTISSSVSWLCILLCVFGARVFTITKTPFGGLQNVRPRMNTVVSEYSRCVHNRAWSREHQWKCKTQTMLSLVVMSSIYR